MPMSTKTRNIIYSIGVLFVFITGVLLWGFVFDKGELIIYFSDRRYWLTDYFFVAASFLGEAYIYILLAIVFIFFNYSRSLIIGLTGSIVLGSATLLKEYFMHHRPYRYFTEYVDPPIAINYVPYVEIHNGYTTSFPSGHTMSAFAIYTILALWSDRLSIKFACLITATLVAISRVYLAQHFLKDILAGLVLGYLIGLLMYAVSQQLKNNKILQGKIKKPV